MLRRGRVWRWVALAAALASACGGAWLAGARPAATVDTAWLLVPADGGGAVAFSPAGRAVAVRRCPPACADGRAAAWSLSPDGRTLAWIERSAGGAETLRVEPADGPGAGGGAGSEASPAVWTVTLPEPAPLPGERLPPAAPRLLWNPNGRAVLVLPLEGPPLAAWTDVRDVTPLDAPSARSVRAAAWSSDGASVALVIGSRDGGADQAGAVLVADAHTGHVRVQAAVVAPAEGVAWFDGRVVFAAYEQLDWTLAPALPRRPRLWTLDLSGRLRAWTPLPTGWRPLRLAGAPVAAPLFFAALEPERAAAPGEAAGSGGAATRGTAPAPAADLWAFDPQRGQWRRLSKFATGSVIVALAPAPDGRRAAFVVERRSGARAYRTVWLVAGPEAPRRLGGNGAYGVPSWAPLLPEPWTTTAAWLPNA
ncbi:MAG: PD40 domain-containing protein [Firmicutes bacterium]|nr:PD40 domain-containing protein [Bacillota bacterium]